MQCVCLIWLSSRLYLCLWFSAFEYDVPMYSLFWSLHCSLFSVLLLTLFWYLLLILEKNSDIISNISHSFFTFLDSNYMYLKVSDIDSQRLNSSSLYFGMGNLSSLFFKFTNYLLNCVESNDKPIKDILHLSLLLISSFSI